MHPLRVALSALLAIVPTVVSAQVALTKRSYQELNSSKGLVILHVNWGRYWNCGGHENAQLQRLSFRRIDASADVSHEKDWVLAPASTLLTRPHFDPYAVYLDPGEYALSGFRFKIANSVTDIQVAEPGPADLIVEGKPMAGSFTVGAGEAVYIGHFGVDCNGEPTPWRYHLDGSKEFAGYVDGFHKHFGFMKDAMITFRLFKTESIGQPYELPK